MHLRRGFDLEGLHRQRWSRQSPIKVLIWRDRIDRGSPSNVPGKVLIWGKCIDSSVPVRPCKVC